MTALSAQNMRLVQNPQKERMLLQMCNMKLTCSLALSEVEQMQREVKRVAAEFNDGGERYFGLTSWPRVEEMFTDDLPVKLENASIDWNSSPRLGISIRHGALSIRASERRWD